jgi:hypothetical protein
MEWTVLIIWNIWSKSLSFKPGNSYIDSITPSHSLTFLTSYLTSILCFVLHCHVEFCNVPVFYGLELLALWTAPKLEKHSLSTVINRENWRTRWKDCRGVENIKERCSPSASALHSFCEVRKIIYLIVSKILISLRIICMCTSHCSERFNIEVFGFEEGWRNVISFLNAVNIFFFFR